ncbi:hypothetical protein AB0N14_09905, partial [Streptomyces sp. NPDC051104]
MLVTEITTHPYRFLRSAGALAPRPSGALASTPIRPFQGAQLSHADEPSPASHHPGHADEPSSASHHPGHADEPSSASHHPGHADEPSSASHHPG